MMRKSFLANFTILSMIVVLAACTPNQKQQQTIQEKETKQEIVTKSKEVPLKFGIIANKQSVGLKKQMKPLAKDLEKHLDRPVELVSVKSNFRSDYNKIVDGFRNQTIDLGFLGANTLAMSVNAGWARELASVASKSGIADYHTVMIVHRDSNIKSFDDIVQNPGKYSFAFGLKFSNFGTLLPSYFFQHYGIDPHNLFKSVKHNSYKNNLAALIKKEIDVTVVDSGYLCFQQDSECYYKQDFPHIQKDLFKAIWLSPAINYEVIATQGNMDKDLRERIGEFFYNYGKAPEQKAVLDKIKFYNIGAFYEINNEDTKYLRSVRKIMRNNFRSEKERKQRTGSAQRIQKTEKFYKITEDGKEILFQPEFLKTLK